MNSIRIGIADDHPIFRNGLINNLESESDLTVRIAAGTGRELLEKMVKIKVDIVVTDVSMPDMDGIQVTKVINRDYKGIGVIGLSMFDDLNIIQQMIVAGIKGYVLKSDPLSVISEAIRKVQNGGIAFGDGIATALIDVITNRHQYDPEKIFSVRERLIMKMIFEERTDQEMAKQLQLSVKSIGINKKALLDKIGAKSEIGLVKHAIEFKLFERGVGF